jgi:hypothetical protein
MNDEIALLAKISIAAPTLAAEPTQSRHRAAHIRRGHWSFVSPDGSLRTSPSAWRPSASGSVRRTIAFIL